MSSDLTLDSTLGTAVVSRERSWLPLVAAFLDKHR